MTKNTWWVVGAVVIGLAAAYGAGRFTAPSQRQEKSTEDTTSKSNTATVEAKNATATEAVARKTTIRKAPARPAAPAPPSGVCPECPAIDETVIEEQIQKRAVDLGVTSTVASATTTTKTTKDVTTTYEHPRLTLGVGAGAALRDLGNPGIAGAANYRVTGPFGVWAAGTTANGGVAMAGVSITF